MDQITIVGGGLAGLTAAGQLRRAGSPGAAARGARGARRPRPEHDRPLQGEPRAPRAALEQSVLALARAARPAPALRPTAAVGRPLPLARRDPPCPGRRRGRGRAAAPRPLRPDRPRLPHLGLRSRRQRGRRPAGAQRRDPHLLPRSRRAVGGVRLGAAGARAAVGAADGAVPDRRLVGDRLAAARPGARPRRHDRDRQPDRRSCRRRR